MTDENHSYIIFEKNLRTSPERLEEPGKILGKNLWVMGPLKENTTIETIALEERLHWFKLKS